MSNQRRSTPRRLAPAILFITLLSTAAGCSDDGASTPDDAAIALDGPPGVDQGLLVDQGTAADALKGANKPGRRVHTLKLHGLDREVIVYVPAKAKGVQVPVVFMFHGTSGDGQKFYNISGWKEQADKEGLIAVFPSGLTYCLKEDDNSDGKFTFPAEAKVTAKWADGKLGGATQPLCTAAEIGQLSAVKQAKVKHPLADDVALVKAMIKLLQAEYLVDVKRIYASGFSNGGNFTARLALELSEQLAAVAVASGGLQLPSAPAKRALSVVHHVGQVEAGLLATLGLPALPMDKTLPTAVPEVGQMLAKMLTMLQLSSGYTFSTKKVSGKEVARYKYATSSTSAANSFTFIVIEGQTHQYPNGTNHPVVAAEMLWDFFSKQALP